MAKLNVNGKTVDVKVDGDTPLLWALREQVGLTGTNVERNPVDSFCYAAFRVKPGAQIANRQKWRSHQIRSGARTNRGALRREC